MRFEPLRGVLGAVLWITAAVGCGGGSGDPAGDGTDGCDTDCAATDDDGTSTTDNGPADDDDDDSVDESGDDGEPAANDLPCGVRDALYEHCMPCHDDPPIYGAPMSLLDYEDLLLPANSDPARTVHEVVAERLVDNSNPMPPGADMDDDDRQILLDWIAAGAPSSTCDDDPIDPGDDPEVGPEALPCEPTHTFVAHADGDDEEAFQVPEVGADNLYQCFTFRSPLTEPTQATAWAPIVDDERVLHHWILYRTPTPQVDGGVGPCQMPSDTVFVAGWAPGGLNFEMPEDVGLELGGPDDYYILQIHYHNAAQYPDAFDRSGVALCTAEEPREQTAGIFTLGAVGINVPAGEDASVQGTCPSWITNYLTEPLRVIASFPHMHEIGTSIRTDIMRGGTNGPIENLLDVPVWDFEGQEFYPHDPEVLIEPGDAIRTTCDYHNPYDFDVTFGEETEDEMCFNFVMVYPIDLVGDYRRCGLL